MWLHDQLGALFAFGDNEVHKQDQFPSDLLFSKQCLLEYFAANKSPLVALKKRVAQQFQREAKNQQEKEE